MEVFTNNFLSICDELACRDKDLKGIVTEYGYPPLWYRPPTFETLVHFILEQQVSLASALAALNKLKTRLERVTPEGLLHLTDEELKTCYFSRQKIGYVRGLAREIISGNLRLEQLQFAPDDEVRATLKRIKGIGDWTADVFLMMSLHRCNCFPVGDVALIASTRTIKKLPPHASKDEILLLAMQWQPYRTVAAYLLWHAYLERRKAVLRKP